MKLSAWSKLNRISYKTAWRWFKTGKMPVRAIQTPTGMILVDPEFTQITPNKKQRLFIQESHTLVTEINCIRK